MLIKNPKLVQLLKDKEALVKDGRQKSKEIEKIELKIAELDKMEREITAKVQPEELIAKGEELRAKINLEVEELQKIGTEIENLKIASIPKDIVKKHYALRDEKEKLVTERNKIALKIQKIKDRAVPIIQKYTIPVLSDTEDIGGAELNKNDEVVITIIDKVEEYKQMILSHKK